MPDLAGQRHNVARIFDDVFHPEFGVSSKHASRRLYNISLGQPLSHYPVIHDALLFLDMAVTHPVSFDHYSQMLYSPFWEGAEKEVAQRAVLDADIRKIGDLTIPIRRFLEIVEKIRARKGNGANPLAVLADRVTRFLRMVEAMPGFETPSRWAGEFTNLLDALGWPGDRALNSEEFQAAASWREALQRFAEMDRVTGPMNAASAYSDFKRMVDDTIFQPESADAPVQVMGLLEAAGEAFDRLWVMGLSSESWPKPSHPNPLLAVNVQRRHHVPHSSAQWELSFAQKMIQRFADAAEHLVVSWSVSDGDADLSPSPLIAEMKESEHGTMKLRASDDHWSRIQSALEMEKVQDARGPLMEDNTPVSGGTGLVKAQAACPFSAYAKYRLKAESMEVPAPGLNAARRGGLVHRALQLVWEILESRYGLVGRDQESLRAVVESSVERAVAEQARSQPGTFTDRFAALERERLINLVIGWLEVDRQRSPFTVIQREKKEPCAIGGIELHTIVDRIDRLDDGRVVIVDYKTGEVSEKNWFTERMADPQLPLYSIMLQEPVAGVLFARVKKGEFRYFGITADDSIAPGVKGLAAARKVLPDCESIGEVIGFWREKIESLAAEFKTGHAAVSPVSIRTTCRYCDIKPLCRIGEAVNLDEGK